MLFFVQLKPLKKGQAFKKLDGPFCELLCVCVLDVMHQEALILAIVVK